MNCDSAITRKNMFPKNLNSLKSTVGMNVRTLYFWLFSLFVANVSGRVAPLSSILRLC